MALPVGFCASKSQPRAIAGTINRGCATSLALLLMLRRRHNVIDPSGRRHPCELVARSTDEKRTAGVLQLVAILDADPTIVAKRNIAGDALEQVVQLELFAEGRVGTNDEPEQHHPSSHDSQQAAEAVLQWAKKGRHPKLWQLALWILDRMVIVQQELVPGGRVLYKLVFRHELENDMEPIEIDRETGFGVTTGQFTDRGGRTGRSTGRTKTGGKPNVDLLKVDNETYRVKTDLATTNAAFDFAEKERTQTNRRSTIEKQMLDDYCEATKSKIAQHKAKREWTKSVQLETISKQQAMKEMSAMARTEKAKAQRKQQTMRWAFMPHLSARQMETGSDLRASSVGVAPYLGPGPQPAEYTNTLRTGAVR